MSKLSFSFNFVFNWASLGKTISNLGLALDIFSLRRLPSHLTTAEFEL